MKQAHRIDEETLQAVGVDIFELPEALDPQDAEIGASPQAASIAATDGVAADESESQSPGPIGSIDESRSRPRLVREVVPGRGAVRMPAQPLASRVARIPAADESGRVVAEAVDKARSSVNRQALESTNRGRSPRSRTYVRGILHPAPFMVFLAAFFAIVVRIVFVAAIVLLGLLFFKKVPAEAMWGLLAVPVIGLIHIITINKARCRVCGQKEFVPSGARKHQKTHGVLFLGPIISTALHLLLFKWFYCMFCGTAVRLKK